MLLGAIFFQVSGAATGSSFLGLGLPNGGLQRSWYIGGLCLGFPMFSPRLEVLLSGTGMLTQTSRYNSTDTKFSGLYSTGFTRIKGLAEWGPRFVGK